VLIAGLAAGCAAVAPDWQSKPIAASESVIRFDHPDFDPKRAEYLVQRDPRSANTVYLARFAGEGAFALLAAVKTGPSYVMEERATEAYVADLLAEAKPDWGGSGRVPSDLGPVPYRMFRLPDRAASCVGFARALGQPADDRNHRKNAVFGYFCQDDTSPISPALAEDLIAKVAIARPQ
jgi:hypothetical protein